MTKKERLEEFVRRLQAAPAATNATEALQLLCLTLEQVEDESGIPNDPTQWRTDGRMYPPQADAARPVKGRPGQTRYRSKGHNTFIGANGSIRIVAVSGATLLDKPGADGKGVTSS